jgi:hypothetical protein
MPSSPTSGQPHGIPTEYFTDSFLRGDIWWVQVSVDNQRISESSKSTKKSDALKLRDKLLAKTHRGEITGGTPDKVLIGELLDDVLKSDIEESTRYIWKLVVEKNQPGDTLTSRLRC